MKNFIGKMVELEVHPFAVKNSKGRKVVGRVLSQHTAFSIRDDNYIQLRLRNGRVKGFPDWKEYFVAASVKELKDQ